MFCFGIIILFACADKNKPNQTNPKPKINSPSEMAFLPQRGMLREARIFKEQVIGGIPLSCGFNLREEESSWSLKKVAEMKKGFQRREVGMMIGFFPPPSEVPLWCKTKNGKNSCGGWGREVGCGRPYD